MLPEAIIGTYGVFISILRLSRRCKPNSQMSFELE